MPKLSAVRVEALRELVDQLRFSAPAAAARHIERAEELAGELDAEQAYPLEWVLFRLTGYRSDQLSGLVTGDALQRDLSALVERLCAHARLTLDDAPGCLGLEELCARWNVSEKTIERYRRRGLVARRVLDPASANARVVFTPASIERFEAAHPDLIERARGFSRISPEDQRRLITRAQRYQRVLGCSRAQAIGRLAVRTGRSPEALRQLIARTEPDRAVPGDTELFESWRRGDSLANIADRFDVSPSTAHARITTWRAHRLNSLRPSPSRHTATDQSIEALLEPAAVRTGLDVGGPQTLAELLALMRTRVVPVGAHERLLGQAIAALRARSAHYAALTPRQAVNLDRAETDLRWASRLKATLARPMLWVVGSQIRDVLGDSVDRLSAEDWRSLLLAVMPAMAVGLDRWDPWSQGRPAGAVTVAVSRAVARWLAASPRALRQQGATRLIEPDSPIADWTLSLDPWQTWLELPPHDPAKLSPGDLKLLAARFGLSGHQPKTAAELAEERGSTPTGIERTVRRIVRTAVVDGADEP